MKRFLVVLALSAVAVGGASVAWAHPFGGDGARREALRACRQEVKEANPEADRATIRAAVRSCLEEAGILPPLTEEQKERRATFRQCLETARTEHPDADRATIRQAVRECVAAS
jgi:ribosomal 50S subunit-associated protein YjgA (DUF615 family)